MANPNPNPATRFGAGQTNGSRGRQKAARDKISTAFLEALNDAFEEPNSDGTSTKGLDAVKKGPRRRSGDLRPHLCLPAAEAAQDRGKHAREQVD
jgi:hypothetical protein